MINKKIFLSYAYKDKDVADEIDESCQSIAKNFGYQIIRDERDLEYNTSTERIYEKSPGCAIFYLHTKRFLLKIRELSL